MRQKKQKERKEGKTNSGRSYSREYPTGRRRALQNGVMLAPRSLRKKGKIFLENCKQSDLRRLGFPESEISQGVNDERS